MSWTFMTFSWINATPIKDSTLFSDTDNSRWGRNKTRFPSEETFLKMRLYLTLQMLDLTGQFSSLLLATDFWSVSEVEDLLFQLSPFGESSIMARIQAKTEERGVERRCLLTFLRLVYCVRSVVERASSMKRRAFYLYRTRIKESSERRLGNALCWWSNQVNFKRVKKLLKLNESKLSFWPRVALLNT